MIQVSRKKGRQSPLFYKNSLYLMYHVAKGKRDKRITQEIEVEVKDPTIEVPSYKCPMCNLSFSLLSSFLLHVYRHSDPCAIQKDIKKEEELEEKEFSYVKDVGEADIVKKEEELGIKDYDLKTEENENKFLESPQVVSEEPDNIINASNDISQPLTIPQNLLHASPTSDFTCHYCSASFSVKMLLRKHLYLHAQYFDHDFQKTQGIETCDLCLTESSSKESLKEHYFKSHKRSSHICRVCKLNFGSNALRRTHERFFHEVEGLDCPLCQFGYTIVKEIKKHSLEAHNLINGGIRNCVHCSNEFLTKTELINHVIECHSSTVTKVDKESLKILLKIPDNRNVGDTENHHCRYCDKRFASDKLSRLHETRQHLASKEDDPGFKCKICSASFNKRANGLRHARRMHGSRINKSEISTVSNQTPVESNFRCDHCKMTFLNSGALISHSRKAHTSQELIFQCAICDKRVTSFRILREHIEAVHEKKLSYFCDLCGKGHARKSGLRTHIKVNHIITRDFVCQICQQRFAQQNQLNVHQKIHSTKKLHTCQVCQKSFAQLSGLNQHMAMHSDTPKYFCSICQLTFKYASSFYNHRKSHVSPTEYKCSECNRQCPSRFSLYVHRKTHHATTTQKFDCSECGKVFKRKDTLKYHILNKHTPHVNYKCEYCDNEGFKTKRDRKRHMNTIHMQLL